MIQCALGLRLDVHLALAQPCEKILSRQINQLNFVRLIQHDIRDGFAHPNSCDLGDHVVETVDMLNIHRREYVDAGGE